MRRQTRSSIAAALIGALTLSSIGFAPAQAAPAKQQQAEEAAAVELSARSRRHSRHRHHHHRYRSDNRAALQMFGLMLGTIASLAAADRARSDCRRYGYCDGYRDGYRHAPPPYYRYRRYDPY